MSVDDANERPWLRRQRQMLVCIVFLAGCVLTAHVATTSLDESHPYYHIVVASPRKNNRKSTRIRNRPSMNRNQHTNLRSRQRSSNNNNARKRKSTGTTRMKAGPFPSGFDVVTLPRNHNASIANDIVSIQYLPAFSRIDIQFRAGARCSRPYLMGRLIGPSLLMLEDWRWHQVTTRDNTTAATVMTGTFLTPIPGRYNLEIDTLHCNDFLHNMCSSSDKENNGADTTFPLNDWDIDEKKVCMEDPKRQRITDQHTVIDVDKTISGLLQQHNNSKTPPRGYWRKLEPQSFSSQLELSTKRCIGSLGSFSPCFSDYQYEPEPLLNEELTRVKLHHHEHTHLCMVGTLQSKERLGKAMNDLLVTSKGPIMLSYKIIHSPSDVTKEFAWNMLEAQNCQKIILISSLPTQPATIHSPSTALHRYQNVVDSMLRKFVDVRSGRFDNVELYVTSMAYHPLNSRMTSCPPKDWTTPPIIDGYNRAISKVCDELGGSQSDVTFISTASVVDPLWDVPRVDGENNVVTALAEAEATHVARIVMGVMKQGDY